MEQCKKCFNKAKVFLFEPTKAFSKEGRTSFGDAFRYVLIIAVVLAVLNAIFIGVFGGPIAFIATLIGTYIAAIIGLLIGGIVLHIFAYIFGARKGIEQTMKVALYGGTPGLLFGWIPIIGWIIGLYGIVLEVIGLKKLQSMSTGAAVAAVLAPIIILGVLVILGLLAFLMLAGSFAGLGGDLTPLAGGFPFS
jgi:hypothetical protein